MKKQKPIIFNDAYTVKFQHKKPDGFVEIMSETVLIPLTCDNPEKNNHEKACKVIESKYKEVKIFSCTYQ